MQQRIWPLGVRDHAQQNIKKFYKQVSGKYKGSSGKRVPEKLHPAMQVWFREYNMSGKGKPYRETDAECHNVCCNVCSNVHSSKQVNRFMRKEKLKRKWKKANIQDCVWAPASKVTEGLGRYDTGKRPMKKIYDPNYDMSDPW